MSGSALTLYLAHTAVLISVLVSFVILRDTFKRSASRSVLDRHRCLELSRQWNQSLLEQVAVLSKENTDMRQALHFYAEPDIWSTSATQTNSLAAKDRGEIARTTLCDMHAGGK